MADPQLQSAGTTHTYLSRAAWRDAQTWTLVLAFGWFLIQNKEFTDMIPGGFHIWIDRALVLGLLWQRFYSATRPVAIQAGTPVEVHSIAPKAAAVEKGEVSDTTRTRYIPLILAVLLASSCASAGGPRHVAVISVVSAHAVLSAVQDTERILVCGVPGAPDAPACVPTATHQQISADLVTAFDLDGRVAKLVRAVPPGGVMPADIPGLLGQIAGLVDKILALIPKSAPQQQLVAQIAGVK